MVPYTGGGITDVVTRLVTQKMSAPLGQAIVVDNRPGANSRLGADIVAKAQPDGYTMLTVIAGHAANATLYAGKLPYDAFRVYLVAHSMGPAELLDYAHRRIKGLVLEEGSPTAHVAIVARAFDIPVVGRVEEATRQIEAGDATRASLTYKKLARFVTPTWEQKLRFGETQLAEAASLAEVSVAPDARRSAWFVRNESDTTELFVHDAARGLVGLARGRLGRVGARAGGGDPERPVS